MQDHHNQFPDKSDGNGSFTIAGMNRCKQFSVGPVRYDNREGTGAIPWVEDISYFGAVAAMTPKTFLALTPPKSRTTTEEYLLAEKPPIGMPFLRFDIDLENDLVYTDCHEGRSRMRYLAKVLGENAEVPVAVMIKANGSPVRAGGLGSAYFRRINEGAFSERIQGEPSSEFVSGPLIFSVAFRDEFHEFHAPQSFRP